MDGLNPSLLLINTYLYPMESVKPEVLADIHFHKAKSDASNCITKSVHWIIGALESIPLLGKVIAVFEYYLATKFCKETTAYVNESISANSALHPTKHYMHDEIEMRDSKWSDSKKLEVARLIESSRESTGGKKYVKFKENIFGRLEIK